MLNLYLFDTEKGVCVCKSKIENIYLYTYLLLHLYLHILYNIYINILIQSNDTHTQKNVCQYNIDYRYTIQKEI